MKNFSVMTKTKTRNKKVPTALNVALCVFQVSGGGRVSYQPPHFPDYVLFLLEHMPHA